VYAHLRVHAHSRTYAHTYIYICISNIMYLRISILMYVGPNKWRGNFGRPVTGAKNLPLVGHLLDPDDARQLRRGAPRPIFTCLSIHFTISRSGKFRLIERDNFSTCRVSGQKIADLRQGSDFRRETHSCCTSLNFFRPGTS